MHEPLIQVRAVAQPSRPDRRVLVLALLLSLGGGTSGALWTLWSLRDDGRHFRFAQPLEAPQAPLVARAARLGAPADDSVERLSLSVRPVRDYRGALGAGGAPALAPGAQAAGFPSFETLAAFEAGSASEPERAVGVGDSREFSTAYAAATAPGRPLGVPAAASRSRRTPSGRSALAGETRVFRSDSGTAWRQVAALPGAGVPADLRDAPNAGNVAPSDVVTARQDGSGREALGIDPRLAKLKDAGPSAEIAALKSTSLSSGLDDATRREVLRVLEDRAESGVVGLAACHGANATERCMEAVRRCNMDDVCRRRTFGR